MKREINLIIICIYSERVYFMNYLWKKSRKYKNGVNELANILLNMKKKCSFCGRKILL